MMKLAGFLIFLLCAEICSEVHVAAQTAVPLSADLGRYYFASPAAEVAARADLDAALKRLGAFKGQLNSGSNLLKVLQAQEDVLKIYRKHAGYLHFRCSLNPKDPACESEGQLESQVDAATAFLSPEILAIPEDRLQAFYAAEAGLKPYKFAIEDIRREAARVLPGPEEALLDGFRPEIADWQYDLYQQIVAGIPFGTVQTATGPLDVIRQRNLLMSNPDARVREEAFKRRLDGFASRRDLLAFALIQTIKAQNALARAHHYPDAPARKYSSMYLDPAQTRALLAAMAQHGEVARRFEKILGDNFLRTNHTQFQAWDESAPSPDFVPPVTSLADIPHIFHEAFAELGVEYQKAFDALVDPASGRADIVPGGAPGRYSGGFSIGFLDSTSMLFLGRYDGTIKDLSVIAHEGGHATHRGLMSANQVRPLYADGPSFLFESFAAFNELVLADYLAAHATDFAARRFYLQKWMQIKGLDAFYGAQDAILEQQIYDGVAAGTIRDADGLDKLTLQVDGQFSIFPATTPELRNRWAAVSLMYEDPFYDVNYVYGGLLALKYYQLYTANREQFVPRYTALLKNGFDAPPAVLLRQFLNIDLSSPALVQEDIDLLNRRLDQLEASPSK